MAYETLSDGDAHDAPRQACAARVAVTHDELAMKRELLRRIPHAMRVRGVDRL